MDVSRWLGERFRYLASWPANLIRDLPVRVGRLLETMAQAFGGVLSFMPELADAIRYYEFRPWVRYKSGRVLDWIHRLVSQLFDLVGGPELGQFLFHFFTVTTPLTGDEIAMMSDILGPEGIRFGEARVAQGGLLDIVFRFNGNRAFATWRTINIPRSGRSTRANRSLVAHELTHVFQYEEVGSRYLGEAIFVLVKTKRDCYDYGGRSGLQYARASGVRYDDYNREQQAMIVQDYATLTRLGADVSAYEPFIEDLRSGLV